MNYDLNYTGDEINAILATAKELKDNGYIFRGVATTTTNPGTPTQKVYYEAKNAGTYTYFGGAVLSAGLHLLIWNGSAWSTQTFLNTTNIPVQNSEDILTSGGAYDNCVINNVMNIPDINSEKAKNARVNINAPSYDGIYDISRMSSLAMDYYLNASTISNNQWVPYNDGTYVGYYHLSKGNIVRLTSKYITGKSSSSIDFYWMTDKPVYEETDFTNTLVFKKAINSTNGGFSCEYIAPADGYLVIRKSNQTELECFLLANYTNISNYKEESMIGEVPIRKNYLLNGNADSENYGEVVYNENASNYGTSGFLDIHDAVYLRIVSAQSTVSLFRNNLYACVVFYDSEKHVISHITYQYTAAAHSKNRYIARPSNAYYIRISGYSNVDSADGIRRISSPLIYKTLQSNIVEDDTDIIANTLVGRYVTVETETKTIVPSSVHTYNAVFGTSSHEFEVASTRLSYFPEIYFVGGTSITIHCANDGHGFRIVQYGNIPLGTGIFDVKGKYYIKEDNISSTEESAEIVLDNNCKRVVFVVKKNSEGNVIRPWGITNYLSSIEYQSPVEYSSKQSSTGINDDNLLRQSRFVSDNQEIAPLTLLHITDIHEDDTSVSECLEYSTENNSLINDVLCTGDIPVSYPDNTSYHEDTAVEWWKSTDLIHKVLFTLGNHDGATYNDGVYDWDGKGKAWDFDNYIADYIANVGYIMPTGYNVEGNLNYKACFWHKDYAGQKIRLVGLDAMHRFDGKTNPSDGSIDTSVQYTGTNEQEIWLAAVLAETLDSNNAAYGYSVVFACHYPIDAFNGNNEQWDDNTHKFIYNHNENGGRVMSYKTSAPANFHLETTTSMTPAVSQRLRNAQGYNNIADIIDSWRELGGKYVAWLSGHYHRDYCYYPTDYPNMLTIGCDQAGTLRDSHTGFRNNMYGYATAFNMVTIDTQNGLIKLIRVGYTLNYRFNSHVYMCYDYINRKVLNEG